MLTITLLVSVFISASVSAEAIKAGVLFSATGGYAGFGKPAQRGALLALEQANAAGGMRGQPIETIVYDAESNADQASRQTKKLIAKDKVIAIIAGRHMTMLPEYHYIQHDIRDLIIVRWDAGEKRFRKVDYVRDVMK